MFQGPVVQHGQVEASAVPGHQVRRVTFDAVEKALHEFLFRGILVAEAPDLERFRRAEGYGDGHHAMQVQRQEVVSRRLQPFERHRRRDVLVRQAVQVQQEPPGLDVRHGFNIEGEAMHVNS